MIRFASLPNQWTPIALGREIGRQPVSATVDDVPVVVFRGKDGGASVLVDRCPHRGARLSAGRGGPDGVLQCPFHGWRFDGLGACVGTPFDGPARSSRMHATRLPSFEAAGLVWVYTGLGEEPARPTLHPALEDPGYVGYPLHREWDAHWSRAIQTMLDLAHIPFVHPFTIGFALGRGIGRGAQARLEVDLTEHDGGGFDARWAFEGEGTSASDSGWVTFLPPNGVVLPMPQAPPREWLLFIFCVPIEAGRSRQIVVPRRNFGRGNPLLGLADRLNARVLHEDQANVEGLWPPEVPPPGQEISVPSDAPTIAFQRYYHDTFGPLRDERAAK